MNFPNRLNFVFQSRINQFSNGIIGKISSIKSVWYMQLFFHYHSTSKSLPSLLFCYSHSTFYSKFFDQVESQEPNSNVADSFCKILLLVHSSESKCDFLFEKICTIYETYYLRSFVCVFWCQSIRQLPLLEAAQPTPRRLNQARPKIPYYVPSWNECAVIICSSSQRAARPANIDCCKYRKLRGARPESCSSYN